MSNIAIDSDDADTEDRPDCWCETDDPKDRDPNCPVHGEDASVSFYTVAIFLVDRAYGGPEEGGWWFNTGEPIDHIPDGINPHDLITVFDARDDVRAAMEEAIAWTEKLQAQLDAGPNHGRREISSVLSTGRYAAEMQAGWPKAYPETRPHYE
jgi:hypothetical protein